MPRLPSRIPHLLPTMDVFMYVCVILLVPFDCCATTAATVACYNHYHSYSRPNYNKVNQINPHPVKPVDVPEQRFPFWNRRERVDQQNEKKNVHRKNALRLFECRRVRVHIFVQDGLSTSGGSALSKQKKKKKWRRHAVDEIRTLLFRLYFFCFSLFNCFFISLFYFQLRWTTNGKRWMIRLKGKFYVL